MKKNMLFPIFYCFLFLWFMGIDLAAQTEIQVEKYTKNREERLSWWKEARYGMFVHWGVYAQLAGEYQGKRIKGPGEWIMYNAQIPVEEYEEIVKIFNPVKFDAKEWVGIAKAAGMRYIVITAKHCDGFAMFHSDSNPYNIKDATPFARDPIAELKDACEKEDIKLGFYYSHNWDWHEPNALGLDNTWDFPERDKKDPAVYYENKALPQIRELMEKYNPDIMWFDVPTDISRERSFEILKLIREIDPDCIINDRISHEHMDKKLVMGDYYTPEQFIPQNLDMNFETCMTLNETWGYVYYDQDWKDAGTIIRNLLTNASMGGNYLLNVGPDQLGRIPFRSVCVLKEVGEWLDVNGESIYGSVRSPLNHVFYNKAACTRVENKIYIHLFEWPEKDMLVIPEVNAEIERIYFLADKKKTNLEYDQNSTHDLQVNLNHEHLAPNVFGQQVFTLVVEYSGTLKAQQLPPIVDPFNTAVFLPSGAEFSGNITYEFNKKWGEHRGYELKEWNTGGAMTWDYRTLREGLYSVELVYGAHELSDDNDIWVSIGEESFKHKIKKYEGWYNNMTVVLGKVELEEGLTGKLEVKAGYSNTHLIANFTSVRLVPMF